jgi:hypothetical protein
MYLGMCEAARELLPMPKARYFIHVSRHTHTHTHTGGAGGIKARVVPTLGQV